MNSDKVMFAWVKLPYIFPRNSRCVYPKKNTPKEQPKENYMEDCVKYLHKIADDFVSPKEHIAYMKRLYDVYPGAFFNLALHKIALEMDTKYPDNIRNSEVIFVYNNVTGTICRYPVESLSKNSFKYFAAFRTKEECIQAIRMVSKMRYYLENIEIE